MNRSQQTELARQFLQFVARANYGPAHKFGQMIRQSDNDATRKLGVSGWFARALYIKPNLIFAEMRINDVSRFVGCPNPPECYVVSHNNHHHRFRDYGRALRALRS